jgi:hypothetical protein
MGIEDQLSDYKCGLVSHALNNRRTLRLVEKCRSERVQASLSRGSAKVGQPQRKGLSFRVGLKARFGACFSWGQGRREMGNWLLRR